MYGVIEAPSRGWTDGFVLAALVGGLLLLTAFVLVERRVAAPMIDLHLFARRRFALGTAAGTISSFFLIGMLFITPLFLQAVRGSDALGVGLRLLPLIGGCSSAPRSASGSAARSVRRSGHGRAAPRRGGAGARLDHEVGSSYGFIATWLAIAGFGTGFGLAPAMDTVIGELPRERAGSGTALTMTVRQVGGALGVALLGSILSAVYLQPARHDRPAGPGGRRGEGLGRRRDGGRPELGDAALARSAAEPSSTG